MRLKTVKSHQRKFSRGNIKRNHEKRMRLRANFFFSSNRISENNLYNTQFFKQTKHVQFKTNLEMKLLRLNRSGSPTPAILAFKVAMILLLTTVFVQAEDFEETLKLSSWLVPSALLSKSIGITTKFHEMKNGYHLVEKKQKTLDNQEAMTIEFIHSRSIDDQSYTVHWSPPDLFVETQMTQEQVEKFEEDWSNLWNPQGKEDSPHFN